jgi:putative transcriptional regulator
LNRQEIAKTLVRLRGKRTQEEIAKKLGISPSAYSMYETGQRIPRDEVKIKIAKLYNRSVQYIFFNPKVTTSEDGKDAG